MKHGYVYLKAGLLFLLFSISFTFTYSQQYIVNSEWSATVGNDTSQYLYKKATVKVDQYSNVYTLGSAITSTGHDFLLMKQNSSGDTLFIVNWNGDGDGEDRAMDMFVHNATGNIYIVGASVQDTTWGDSLDAVIVALDNTGAELWHTYSSDSSPYNDAYTSISYDGSTYLFAGGTKGTASQGYDYLVTTYKRTNGSEMYSNSYDYGLDDVSVKTVYDPSNGSIYVAGISETSDTTWDYCIVRYRGATLPYHSANRSYAGSGQTHRPTDAIFANGYYYVTGGIDNGTDFDIKTVCLDTALSVIWEQTWDGPDGMDDISNSIKVDGSGNVYITGRTGRNSWSTDMVTIKYDNTGNEQWVNLYDGSNGTLNDVGTDLELYNDNVYVTGYLNSGSNFNTMCLDTAGNFRWQKVSEGGNHFPTDMAVDGQGNVIIAAPLLFLLYTEKFSILAVSDSIITDTLGAPVCKKNELIVKFNPQVVKTAIVDDRDKVFGKLTDFIQDSTISKMNAKIGWDISKEVNTIKVFKRFTTADSLSLSRLGDTVKLDKMWSTLLITIPDTCNVFEWVDSLNTISNDIYYAEADFIAQLDFAPNDPLYSNQLNCDDSPYPADVNAEVAWDYEKGRSFVKVGIYDTGIDWEHEDFSRDGSGSFSQSVGHNGYDYYYNHTITSSDNNIDFLGHGTLCSGIVGARSDNSTGIAGIAGGNGTNVSGVELYDMKIYSQLGESATLSTIANAIYEGGTYILGPGNYIGVGLNVANSSWSTTDFSETLKNAFYQSWRNGVIHSVSRGNASASSNPTTWDDILYPSCFNDNWLITVGGSGEKGQLANPTNGAPSNYYSMMGGVAYGVPVMDCIAPGTRNIVLQTTSNYSTSDYATFGGTSAAAPHVAGVAALICSHYNDSLNPYSFQTMVQDDVEHLISKYAQDKSTITGYDDSTGWGLLNAGAIFTNIHRPQFEILHFDGLSPDATSSSVEISNDTIWIENYDGSGITPGLYRVNVYVVTHTFNYTLPAGYTYKDSWVLKSHTIGFGLPYPYTGGASTAMNGAYWGEAEIVSSNSSQTIVKTRCYSIDTRLSFPMQYYSNTWLANTSPTSVKIPFAVHIQNPTASVNEETDPQIKLYPNPTSSMVTISGNTLQGLNYSLMNMFGSVIKTGIINDNNNFMMDISTLQSSTYILQLYNGTDYRKTFRIIKL